MQMKSPLSNIDEEDWAADETELMQFVPNKQKTCTCDLCEIDIPRIVFEKHRVNCRPKVWNVFVLVITYSARTFAILRFCTMIMFSLNKHIRSREQSSHINSTI